MSLHYTVRSVAVRRITEATSLELKIPVFYKSQYSAKFFLREILVDYVRNVCKK
jgi:hypothetical protein